MRILFYILIAAIFGLLWSLIEAQLFVVKRVVVKSNKIKKKIKIVFISDLHYGDYYAGKRLDKIINKVNSLKPDIILIGGDYLDFGKNSRFFNKLNLERLFSRLPELKAKYNVITVFGNHEYYLGKDLHFLLKKLEEAEIIILKNQSYSLNISDTKILIHGVDDFSEGNSDFSALKIDNKYLNILVSHNPDFHEEVGGGYDIGLSGHTHGGQITFFGIFAPITESKYGQKYIKLLNKKGNREIITSKGLGCSWMPLRFFAIPDIIELTIEIE